MCSPYCTICKGFTWQLGFKRRLIVIEDVRCMVKFLHFRAKCWLLRILLLICRGTQSTHWEMMENVSTIGSLGHYTSHQTSPCTKFGLAEAAQNILFSLLRPLQSCLERIWGSVLSCVGMLYKISVIFPFFGLVFQDLKLLRIMPEELQHSQALRVKLWPEFNRIYVLMAWLSRA